MKEPIEQTIERGDPTVAQFLVECGIEEHNVRIRLTAQHRNDVLAQANLLACAYGSRIEFGSAYTNQRGGWTIAGIIRPAE